MITLILKNILLEKAEVLIADKKIKRKDLPATGSVEEIFTFLKEEELKVTKSINGIGAWYTRIPQTLFLKVIKNHATLKHLSYAEVQKLEQGVIKYLVLELGGIYRITGFGSFWPKVRKSRKYRVPGIKGLRSTKTDTTVVFKKAKSFVK